MSVSLFETIPPRATLQPRPFRASLPDNELKGFKDLLALSKIGPETYENLSETGDFGIQRRWLKTAKEKWASGCDWRKTENRINTFPNFAVDIAYSSEVYTVHFAALFSQKQNAIPVLFLHGWPGSFLEFLDVLDVYRNKYSPTDLPYHIIVPSLPGYGYSSGPPLDKSFKMQDQAGILDLLMAGLGFSDGYIAQGGDIGSFIARILGATSEHCKAVHLNFCPMELPNDIPEEYLDAADQAGVLRLEKFVAEGAAYAFEHRTRPATIGLVLSSNPLALLAWIGEKYLEWSGPNLSLDEILDAATLYWFTDTFPRSIFPYRNAGEPPSNLHGAEKYFLGVPLGYSCFPEDFAPTPVSWVKTTGNLVWYKRHEHGGHFAAMEEPEAFVEDADDFVATVLKNGWQR